MLVFLILVTILIITAYYSKLFVPPYHINKWFLVNIVVAGLLFTFHIFEIMYFKTVILDSSQTFFNANFFTVFDELFFYEKMSNYPTSSRFLTPLSQLQDAKLSFLFNIKYELYYIFGFLTLQFSHPLALKLVNLFFVFFILLLLYSVSNRNPKILMFFPICFPYLYLLSFTNMRDMQLIFFSLFLFRMVDPFRKRHLLLIIPICILILSYRPIMLFVSLFIILIILYPSLKKAHRYILLTLAGLLCILSAPFIVINFRRATILTIQAITNGGGSITSLYLQGIFKQLLAPVPISKINYLLNPANIDTNPKHTLHIFESSRILLMSWVYVAYGVVLFNLKSFWTFIRSSQFNVCLFWFALFNTLMYVIYMGGMGSSRNKLYPFILIFLYIADRMSPPEKTSI